MTGRPIYRKALKHRGWQDPSSGIIPPELLPTAPRFSAEMTAEAVRCIASRGFPLKEDTPTIVLRNKRVTVGYQDLGACLARLLNRPDRVAAGETRQPVVWDDVANWCTIAAWSSRTIGATIDPAEMGQMVPPGIFHGRLVKLMQSLRRRDHGKIFRALATGNRFIFLEVGLATTAFIDRFTPITQDPGEVAWREYLVDLEGVADELARLDPSWVPSRAGNPVMLHSAMRLYYEALFVTSRATDFYAQPTRSLADLKSELMLAANIQLGAYEQYRADGYVLTSFAWFGDRAFRRLLVRGTGRSRWPHKWLATWAWTRLVTHYSLSMLLPYEVIRLGRPLKPPVLARGERGELERRGTLFGKHVSTIDEPRVQALLARFDLNDDEERKRGAKNWMHYRERMHVIANLFRAYHDVAALWEVSVFRPDIVEDLRAGYLPGTRDLIENRRPPGGPTPNDQ